MIRAARGKGADGRRGCVVRERRVRGDGLAGVVPEKELPLKEAVTGWLYQPFRSGGREGNALMDGADASTFSGKLMS